MYGEMELSLVCYETIAVQAGATSRARRVLQIFLLLPQPLDVALSPVSCSGSYAFLCELQGQATA